LFSASKRPISGGSEYKRELADSPEISPAGSARPWAATKGNEQQHTEVIESSFSSSLFPQLSPVNSFFDLTDDQSTKTNYSHRWRGNPTDKKSILSRGAPNILRVQPDHWLAEYTTELLNVLHVLLALLVEMERPQSQLLEAICVGPTLGFRG
jgi:hypothetical protein